ncbi:Transcription factor, SBP-box, partial [Corchorus capsularis]
VEGSNLDLSSARDYHREYRVCESHSKSPKVILSALERRFCQQCSRIQLLHLQSLLLKVLVPFLAPSCISWITDYGAQKDSSSPPTLDSDYRRGSLTPGVLKESGPSFCTLVVL